MTVADTIAAWQTRLAAAAATPLPASVPAFIKGAVAAVPDRVLIDLFETAETITYRQFDALSDRLAAAFQVQGLGPGSRIGVMVPNGAPWHISWLAALKIGAAVVPINPSYTRREFDYVSGDAEIGALIVAPDCADRLLEGGDWPGALPRARIWRTADTLDAPCPWRDLLASVPADAQPTPAAIGLETLANIQYTSGTTGFPKGCLLTQGYWLHLMQSASLMIPPETTRFFTAQPFFYMDPFWQLLLTVRHHGTLCAARKLSATRFLGWLADRAIEWAQLPELALKSIDSVAGRQMALRSVFTFGWSADGRAAFTRRFGVPARESFGMTEIGLGLAMPDGLPADFKPVSVGINGFRAEARIVDDQGVPLSGAATGELQIRGPYLFKGYLNKPEANAEAFVDGWFRTGDVFQRDEDGFYRIVGRFKDMIRRSSENIAAREIEAVVRELPEVLDCAALPVPDPVRTEEVKIAIQLKPEMVGGRSPVEVLPLARLFDHCRARLAPFKLPRYVEFVADFPRTSSNKIAKHVMTAGCQDRRAGCYDRVEDVWHPG